MDIFRLLYVEGIKPSAIAVALNREPEKGMSKGMYNPVLAEA
jgi:hypothetical protein